MSRAETDNPGSPASGSRATPPRSSSSSSCSAVRASTSPAKSPSPSSRTPTFRASSSVSTTASCPSTRCRSPSPSPLRTRSTPSPVSPPCAPLPAAARRRSALFFDWNADMFKTLQLVDAALSKVRQERCPPQLSSPPTASPSPRFPSSATASPPRTPTSACRSSGRSPPTSSSRRSIAWTASAPSLCRATRSPTSKLRLRPPSSCRPALRSPISSPRFKTPTSSTPPASIKRSTSSCSLSSVRRFTTPALSRRSSSRPPPLGIPIQVGDVRRSPPGHRAQLHRRAGRRQARGAAQHRAPAFEQHRAGRRRSHRRSRQARGVASSRRQHQALLRSVAARARQHLAACVMPSSSASSSPPLIIVIFLRDWRSSLIAGARHPHHHRDHLRLSLRHRPELQPDDARWSGRRGRTCHRRRHRRRREHRPASRLQAKAAWTPSAKPCKEITVPLLGSTITPIVVFLPLIAVTGVTGSFFRALAITMTGVAALLAAPGPHLDTRAQRVAAQRRTHRRPRSRSRVAGHEATARLPRALAPPRTQTPCRSLRWLPGVDLSHIWRLLRARI